ncbi:hypothetical protein L6R50_15180 [Myxococcota bacterium]|nr:hypothetical protein [Myxococcota bacterium]
MPSSLLRPLSPAACILVLAAGACVPESGLDDDTTPAGDACVLTSAGRALVDEAAVDVASDVIATLSAAGSAHVGYALSLLGVDQTHTSAGDLACPEPHEWEGICLETVGDPFWDAFSRCTRYSCIEVDVAGVDAWVQAVEVGTHVVYATTTVPGEAEYTALPSISWRVGMDQDVYGEGASAEADLRWDVTVTPDDEAPLVLDATGGVEFIRGVEGMEGTIDLTFASLAAGEVPVAMTMQRSENRWEGRIESGGEVLAEAHQVAVIPTLPLFTWTGDCAGDG